MSHNEARLNHATLKALQEGESWLLRKVSGGREQWQTTYPLESQLCTHMPLLMDACVCTQQVHAPRPLLIQEGYCHHVKDRRGLHTMKTFMDPCLANTRRQHISKMHLLLKKAFIHLWENWSPDAADTLQREVYYYHYYHHSPSSTVYATWGNIPECEKQSLSSWKRSLATFYPFKSIAY